MAKHLDFLFVLIAVQAVTVASDPTASALVRVANAVAGAYLLHSALRGRRP